MNPRKKANLIIIFTVAIFAFSSSLVVASLTSDMVDLNTLGLPVLTNNQIDNEKLNTVEDANFSPDTVNKVFEPKQNNNSINSNNSNNSNKTKPNNTLSNSSD